MANENPAPSPVGTPYRPMPRPWGSRRSFFGPLALITIGVLFLLINMHMLSYYVVGRWFAQYWPAVLIVWGLVRLVEYLLAQRGGYAPPRMGGGAIVFLVFLCLFGAVATRTMNFNWSAIHSDLDIDEDSNPFFHAFNNSYTYNDQLVQDFVPGSTLTVNCNRGAIKISTSEDNKIHVAIHKRVFAGSESEGSSINDRTRPVISVTGSTIQIDASRNGGNQFVSDLEILLPRKAPLELLTSRGDIEINGRDGDVKANTSRGNVSFSDIQGSVEAHMRKGDFTAQNISGDVTVEGRVNDSSVSNVKGSVTLNGEFFGEMKLSKIAKELRFKSNRTDLEFARLDGDMDLSTDDLHANSVVGPVRLSTRSKDIRFDGVSGDVNIQNSNAQVELHPTSPLGSIEVNNKRGSINLFVPSNAGFELDARAVNGEIQDEFDVNVQSDTRGSAKSYGTAGKGGPKVNLTTDRGNIEIHKG